ncbi:retrotransposable element Tf2 [Tanacetum coccineum]
MLELRDKMKPFVVYKIRNGKKTSLWFKGNETVKEGIYTVLWLSTDNKESKFSSKLAWLSLKENWLKVEWSKIVWFSQCNPKQAFILWMAIQGKLLTQDIMMTGVQDEPSWSKIYTVTRGKLRNAANFGRALYLLVNGSYKLHDDACSYPHSVLWMMVECSMVDWIDPHTKNYVDAAMNEIKQSLDALTTTIAAMGGKNGQMVNPGLGRQANQFSRLANVESLKFQRDNVRDWAFKCDQFFAVDNTLAVEKVKIMYVRLDDKALLWHR